MSARRYGCSRLYNRTGGNGEFPFGLKCDRRPRFNYGPSGFAVPAGVRVPTATMVLCDARGVRSQGTGSTARALFITATGRARASATYADVAGTALGAVGGSCP